MRVFSFLLMYSVVAGCASFKADDESTFNDIYTYKISTGLFSLPREAKSVDWAVLNNSGEAQEVRVTVFKVGVGEKEVLPPGPISVIIEPNHSSHNANSVPSIFRFGYDYEVVIEVNSRLVLPSVEVWSNLGNLVIPGTLIGPANFIDISSSQGKDK